MTYQGAIYRFHFNEKAEPSGAGGVLPKALGRLLTRFRIPRPAQAKSLVSLELGPVSLGPRIKSSE